MKRTTPMRSIVIIFSLSLLAMTPTFAQKPPTIGTEEGQHYPDFLLPTLDNNLERLSDYRGKKILLFHFASW